MYVLTFDIVVKFPKLFKIEKTGKFLNNCAQNSCINLTQHLRYCFK
jgi:hypothetical protein